MSDLRSVLERGLAGFEPSGDALERTLRRADRHSRNRRVTAVVVAAIVSLVGLGTLVGAYLNTELVPAGRISSPVPSVPAPAPSPQGPAHTPHRAFSLGTAGPLVEGRYVLTWGCRSGNPSVCQRLASTKSIVVRVDGRYTRGAAGSGSYRLGPGREILWTSGPLVDGFKCTNLVRDGCWEHDVGPDGRARLIQGVPPLRYGGFSIWVHV